MKLRNITAQQLDQYVAASAKPHFQQTAAWGEVNRKRGYTIIYLGLFDEDKLVGTALLLEKSLLMYRSFYCPRGFVCDYNDHKTVAAFISELKKYAYEHRGLYLKFDPDIIIARLDKNAQRIQEFLPQQQLIEFLKAHGATHKGFTTDFRATAAPRFTFRVNLDRSQEEIFNGFHATTRTILRKNNPHHLKISKNQADDLTAFYGVMKETLLRKKMYVESFDFFKDFYETLKEKDMADIYTVRADIPAIKQEYQEQLVEITEQIAQLQLKQGAKTANKLKDLNDRLQRLKKEYALLEAVKADELTLSGMITVRYGNMVWTIHGGNSDQLSFLNANYELYYQIIKDAKAEGYSWVDFYGSEGKVDPSSPIYGIFLFKLRFGGDFDEFIGEFDLLCRPWTYKLISIALQIRRSLLIKLSLRK